MLLHELDYVTLYHTTYVNAKIEIGNTYTSSLSRDNDLLKSYIETGLHAFVCEKDVSKYLKRSHENKRYAVIVKCLIPKGSKYYVGTFYGYKSYASDTLKYLEILE